MQTSSLFYCQFWEWNDSLIKDLSLHVQIAMNILNVFDFIASIVQSSNVNVSTVAMP
jgi:hypothetical protein